MGWPLEFLAQPQYSPKALLYLPFPLTSRTPLPTHPQMEFLHIRLPLCPPGDHPLNPTTTSSPSTSKKNKSCIVPKKRSRTTLQSPRRRWSPIRARRAENPTFEFLGEGTGGVVVAYECNMGFTVALKMVGVPWSWLSDPCELYDDVHQGEVDATRLPGERKYGPLTVPDFISVAPWKGRSPRRRTRG